MIAQPDEGQWLDFYALLEVPVDADEDVIRKRIGKLYAEAAANSDHRDLAKRLYFQSLVERVLPQCRRVLLDPEWRAKYDRQHFLNSVSDPNAQSYVAFVASMRGAEAVVTGESLMPQRIQEEIAMAQRVIDTARSGAELELIPEQAIVSGLEKTTPAPSTPTAAPSVTSSPAAKPSIQAATQQAKAPEADLPEMVVPEVVSASAQPEPAPTEEPQAASNQRERRRSKLITPTFQKQKVEPLKSEPTANQKPAAFPYVETIHQDGEPVKAQVLTAQEAAEIRRRTGSGPAPLIAPASRKEAIADNHVTPTGRGKKNAARSRVVISNEKSGRKRILSPTSLNLMVAITGVLLTMVIQDAAFQPAVATSSSRTPIYVAASPEMASALKSVKTQWEQTPEGAEFDLVLQPVEGANAINRALGRSGSVPDVWVPTNSLAAERYNAIAPRLKRPIVSADVSIAQTPIVLIARSDRAAVLRNRFPNHQIGSWSALQSAVRAGAAGHFGLANPQRSVTGSVARLSMAREWGAEQDISAKEALSRPAFWRWISGFEGNIPSNVNSSDAAVKDMVLGTTGRFWWVIGYESEALDQMKAGRKLEIFYLPRTVLADHPFCALDRTGAPVEVARGRSQFLDYLQSAPAQKILLREGFRPSEIAPKTNIAGNPFISAANRQRGVRVEGLPRDENLSPSAVTKLESEWGKRFG